jgi:hypothetical protein
MPEKREEGAEAAPPPKSRPFAPPPPPPMGAAPAPERERLRGGASKGGWVSLGLGLTRREREGRSEETVARER